MFLSIPITKRKEFILKKKTKVSKVLIRDFYRIARIVTVCYSATTINKKVISNSLR